MRGAARYSKGAFGPASSSRGYDRHTPCRIAPAGAFLYHSCATLIVRAADQYTSTPAPTRLAVPAVFSSLLHVIWRHRCRLGIRAVFNMHLNI